MVKFHLPIFQVSSNGHPDRQHSLSSDDDMIDITTTGTISERAMLEEELAQNTHGKKS